MRNLSSGGAIPPEVTDNNLSIVTSAHNQNEFFHQERMIKKTKKFHAPITRNKVMSFKDSNKNTTVSSNGNQTTVEIIRNILGMLLSVAVKTNRNIDFRKALQYALSPVPLSLANPDGTKWISTKSKLTEMITNYCISSPSNPREVVILDNVQTYIIDFMPSIRTLTSIPEKNEQLV